PIASYEFRIRCRDQTLVVLFAYPAIAEMSPLSLHDALPICSTCRTPGGAPRSHRRLAGPSETRPRPGGRTTIRRLARRRDRGARSEEHTSELQSPDQLVCRLLLEKKKNEQQPLNCLDYRKSP